MTDAVVKVTVSDVRTAVPATPGVEAGRVTLREEEAPYRSVSVVIAQPEARAIHVAWTQAASRRPSTWDLFVAALFLLGAEVDRVVVTAVEDGRHFFARIEVVKDGVRHQLDARPSDAIALALRTPNSGIYVAEQVFADLGISEPPPDN
ncbi:MAG: bifunctional nuclease family protein [Acidimicrobiales bacterium]